MKLNILFLIVILFSISIVSSEVFPTPVTQVQVGFGSDSGQTGVNVFIPEQVLNVSNASVLSSTIWNTTDLGPLTATNQLDLARLNNRTWLEAGIIIDTTVDFNGQIADFDEGTIFSTAGLFNVVATDTLVIGSASTLMIIENNLFYPNLDASVSFGDPVRRYTMGFFSADIVSNGSLIADHLNITTGAEIDGNLTLKNHSLNEVKIITLQNSLGIFNGACGTKETTFGTGGLFGIQLYGCGDIFRGIFIDGHMTTFAFAGNQTIWRAYDEEVGNLFQITTAFTTGIGTVFSNKANYVLKHQVITEFEKATHILDDTAYNLGDSDDCSLRYSSLGGRLVILCLTGFFKFDGNDATTTIFVEHSTGNGSLNFTSQNIMFQLNGDDAFNVAVGQVSFPVTTPSICGPANNGSLSYNHTSLEFIGCNGVDNWLPFLNNNSFLNVTPISFEHNGTIKDNETCTIILSPDGSTEFAVCDV